MPITYPNDAVEYMMTDSEGIIWIGTWDNSLMRFDGTSWKKFDRFGVPFSTGSPYSNIPRKAIGIGFDNSGVANGNDQCRNRSVLCTWYVCRQQGNCMDNGELASSSDI